MLRLFQRTRNMQQFLRSVALAKPLERQFQIGISELFTESLERSDGRRAQQEGTFLGRADDSLTRNSSLKINELQRCFAITMHIADYPTFSNKVTNPLNASAWGAGKPEHTRASQTVIPQTSFRWTHKSPPRSKHIGITLDTIEQAKVSLVNGSNRTNHSTN